MVPHSLSQFTSIRDKPTKHVACAEFQVEFLLQALQYVRVC
jgi:hypothetical protein